jgi:hypothetical protein
MNRRGVSIVNCYERDVQTVQLVGITAQLVFRLSSLWELLHSGCADYPVYCSYCTVGVQTAQSMEITAHWVCRLSSWWELLHSRCADSPVYGNYCMLSSQWELLEEECVSCPVSGSYSRSHLPDYI